MFLYCSRWVEERRALEQSIGRLPSVDEIIGTMIAYRSVWREIYGFVTEVMKKKETEDRERQG